MRERLHHHTDASDPAPPAGVGPARASGAGWRFVEDFIAVVLLAVMAIASWIVIPR